MSALTDRRAMLLAALYAQFGEAAVWTPAVGGADVPVTVRRQADDAAIDFGGSQALVGRDVIRVRASEIAAPAKGDVIAQDGQADVKVAADPRRVKQGAEWVCEVVPVRA